MDEEGKSLLGRYFTSGDSTLKVIAIEHACTGDVVIGLDYSDNHKVYNITSMQYEDFMQWYVADGYECDSSQHPLMGYDDERDRFVCTQDNP